MLCWDPRKVSQRPCTSWDSRETKSVPSTYISTGGDEELIISITEALARACGPLIVVRDADGAPVLVAPGADPASTLTAWELNASLIE